jgi:aspartate kinase
MATTLLNSDLPVASEARSNWVVQKFGGTSVGKFALNIIEQVIEYDALFHFSPTITDLF